MAQHNILGKTGEDIACEYLIKQGYTIRERNWRMSHYEIDIIAEKGGEFIIIEVKTRTNDYVIDPAESITPKKLSNLKRAGSAYMKFYDLPVGMRIDAIIILHDPSAPEGYSIEHIEDIYIPTINHFRHF